MLAVANKHNARMKNEGDASTKKRQLDDKQGQRQHEYESRVQTNHSHNNNNNDSKIDDDIAGINEAILEAEKIAAEMDLFMMEEEMKIEEGAKQKREEEKYQWEAQAKPKTNVKKFLLPILFNSGCALYVRYLWILD